MISDGVIALILAAGKGTRMRSRLPKVLHPVLGLPMAAYPVRAARAAGIGRVVVIVGYEREAIEADLGRRFPELGFALQAEQRGTGHAVQCAREWFAEGPADDLVVVLNGDLPNLQARTIERLLATARDGGPHVALVTAVLDDPTGYGRIIRDEAGRVVEIVEQADATEVQRGIREGNVGTYAFPRGFLTEALDGLAADNAQGELYLTDLVAAAVARGIPVSPVVVDDPVEVMGVNSRADLAAVEAAARRRRNHALMLAGVSMHDPERTRVEADVELAADVVLEAGVELRGATRVATGVRIEVGAIVIDSELGEDALVRAYSHLEGARVGARCQVGPYGRLRQGAVLGEDARVGNFVELKKTTLGRGSKANHLTYLGDAHIGEGVNVGAGTITCNYDGVNKFPTTIGDGAFIGSNTELVAPVTVGRQAYVGAGSTITEDVPDGALGLGRARQRNIEGYSDRRPAKKA
jgi:bifunctional UDP-N-acetylglucosamine pyrophosphorylase/glucosamine-1-phosphate N-acetyltransferase